MSDALSTDLKALLQRAGVQPRPEALADIQLGWELLQPLLARLRQEDFNFSSEPAPLFRADAYDHEP